MVNDSERMEIAEPTEKITASDYESLGLDVVRFDGRLDRPVGGVTEHLDGWEAYKMYLAITAEKQEELLGPNAKPSDYVVALLPGRYDPNIPDLYVLSQAAPDDFIVGKFERGEYDQINPYAQYGINSTNVKELFAETPRDKTNIASPFFVAGKSKEISAAILDLQKMEGNGSKIKTALKVQDLEKYPERLRKKGEAERKTENKEHLPIVVVSNAVAKALGLTETIDKNTQLPEALGGTIAKSKVCKLKIDNGDEMEVFVCAALDRIGISSALNSSLKLQADQIVRVEFNVGSKMLEIKTDKPVLDEIGTEREKVNEVI